MLSRLVATARPATMAALRSSSAPAIAQVPVRDLSKDAAKAPAQTQKVQSAPAARKEEFSKFKRTPLQIDGIVGKYAHALMNASQRAGSVAIVHKQMVALAAHVEKTQMLKQLFTSPILTPHQRLKSINGLVKASKFHPMVSRTLDVITRNNRLDIFFNLVRSFDALVKDTSGEVVAYVVSAEPLSPAMAQQLTEALKSRMEGSVKLILQQDVDPSIIGGVKILVGDRYGDFSVAKRMELYSEKLKTAALQGKKEKA